MTDLDKRNPTLEMIKDLDKRNRTLEMKGYNKQVSGGMLDGMVIFNVPLAWQKTVLHQSEWGGGGGA